MSLFFQSLTFSINL